MYAEFAQIAAGNAYAWNYGATPESAETIGKVSAGRNRMICFPCKLLDFCYGWLGGFGGVVLGKGGVVRMKLEREKVRGGG